MFLYLLRIDVGIVSGVAEFQIDDQGKVALRIRLQSQCFESNLASDRYFVSRSLMLWSLPRHLFITQLMSRHETGDIERRWLLQLIPDTKDFYVSTNVLSLGRRLLNAGVAG